MGSSHIQEDAGKIASPIEDVKTEVKSTFESTGRRVFQCASVPVCPCVFTPTGDGDVDDDNDDDDDDEDDHGGGGGDDEDEDEDEDWDENIHLHTWVPFHKFLPAIQRRPHEWPSCNGDDRRLGYHHCLQLGTPPEQVDVSLWFPFTTGQGTLKKTHP